MVHPVAAASDPSAPLEYVRELVEELADPYRSPRDKLDAVLPREAAALDLPYSYLSHIDPGADREEFDVIHGVEDIGPGDAIPLSTTPCQYTIEVPGGVFVVSDAEAEGRTDDPGFAEFDVATYLGTRVDVDDELYGTLCFASPEPRPESITQAEVTVAELLAQWSGYELALRDGDLDGTAATDRGTDATVPEAGSGQAPTAGEGGPSGTAGARGRPDPLPMWSDEVDTLFDALRERPRRGLLALLAAEQTTTLDAALDHEAFDGVDRISMEHNHLPRLAEAGYVEWDRDTGAIARGPAFDAVGAVLDCLEATVEEVD